MKKVITRKINPNEDMNTYTSNINKEFKKVLDTFDELNSLEDTAIIHYDPEGFAFIGNIQEVTESINNRNRTKKLNVWVTDRVFDDMKAVQFIHGGISVNEAMNIIINEYMETFRNTEEYQLFMELKDKIEKK